MFSMWSIFHASSLFQKYFFILHFFMQITFRVINSYNLSHPVHYATPSLMHIHILVMVLAFVVVPTNVAAAVVMVASAS